LGRLGGAFGDDLGVICHDSHAICHHSHPFCHHSCAIWDDLSLIWHDLICVWNRARRPPRSKMRQREGFAGLGLGRGDFEVRGAGQHSQRSVYTPQGDDGADKVLGEEGLDLVQGLIEGEGVQYFDLYSRP
jgi:hypothetical protein